MIKTFSLLRAFLKKIGPFLVFEQTKLNMQSKAVGWQAK